MVPSQRIQRVNDASLRSERDYVLYWMTANRRVDWNFSMDRAVELATELGKPLVVLEALRCGYQWASDRLHRFVLDGMRDNARRLAGSTVTYYPYVERRAGDGKGLLRSLANAACVVVTDDFPAFMLPRMMAAAAEQVDVRMEAVDSNGLLPMRSVEKAYSRAYLFRKHLQKVLPDHLEIAPKEDALRDTELPRLARLPAAVLDRWTPLSEEVLAGDASALDDLVADLPIDHSVPAVESIPGGRHASLKRLDEFMETFECYEKDGNHPDAEATSRISPYLHFGHVSAHEIFDRVMEQEGWSVEQLSESTSGSREGWWGMSANAEGFLDQLVTWRELGFNMCVVRPDTYADYDSLPDWALKTLAEHEDDPRPQLYSLEELEAAKTHDEVWNAAQRQLLIEGRIHNYMRMLWGKKILQWTENPRVALAIMLELNNKYALDGRDPNSYSGIFWVLGRYDRAWGPERPIFGKVRYMTSKSAKKKLRLREYLERWSST